ncbi:MAG: PP2C family protein-serine/threonine phosphatase [Phycisphaerales bacterium]
MSLASGPPAGVERRRAPRAPRSRSIRRKLQRNLVALVLVLGAGILAVTVFGAGRAIRSLSALATAQAMDQVSLSLREYLQPLVVDLPVMARVAAAGQLETDDPGRLRRSMVPSVEAWGTVRSIAIVEHNGQAFVIDKGNRRSGLPPVAFDAPNAADPRDVLIDARTGPSEDEPGGPVAVARWISPDGSGGFRAVSGPADADRFDVDIGVGTDLRSEPWFARAVAALSDVNPEDATGPLIWSPPVIGPGGRPEVIGSIAARRPGGQVVVLAMTLSIDDLSAIVSGDQSLAGSSAFILSRELRLLAMPVEPYFDSAAERDSVLLQRATDLDAPVIVAAARALSEGDDDELAPDAVSLAQATDGADAAVELALEGRLPPDIAVDASVVEARSRDDARRFEVGRAAWWVDSQAVAVSPSEYLFVAVLVPESALLGDIRRLRWAIIVITALVMIVGVLRVHAIAGSYSQPIEQLVEQSNRISRGDLETEVRVETDVTEVRELALAQDRMRVGLQTLMRLERDVQIARQIQQAGFPGALTQPPGWQVAADSEPAEATGGDAFDVVPLVPGDPRGPVLLLLADATGHGMGPALSSMQLRGMALMGARAGLPLDELVRLLDRQLCEDLPAAHFITLWVARLDPISGELSWVSAGQGPLMFIPARRGGVEQIRAGRPPLGIDPDLPVMVERRILEPGDAFAVMSDGFHEAASVRGERFGLDRAADLMAASAHRGASAMLEELHREVDRHSAGHIRDDDRTAVIVSRDAGRSGSERGAVERTSAGEPGPGSAGAERTATRENPSDRSAGKTGETS